MPEKSLRPHCFAVMPFESVASEAGPPPLAPRGPSSAPLDWKDPCAPRTTSGALGDRDLHARSVALRGKGRDDQVQQLEGRRARLDVRFLSADA
jgi:hypothetical protein